VRPRLAGLPDVGEVAVEGGRVREITVQLDPARLVANHVSTSQVAEAISGTDQAEAAGLAAGLPAAGRLPSSEVRIPGPPPAAKIDSLDEESSRCKLGFLPNRPAPVAACSVWS